MASGLDGAFFFGGRRGPSALAVAAPAAEDPKKKLKKRGRSAQLWQRRVQPLGQLLAQRVGRVHGHLGICRRVLIGARDL